MKVFLKSYGEDRGGSFLYPIWKFPSFGVPGVRDMGIFFDQLIKKDPTGWHVIICTGSSGAFIVGMLMAMTPSLLDLSLVFYLRKEEEESNGQSNSEQWHVYLKQIDEVRARGLNVSFWFVDDVLCSCETLSRVLCFLDGRQELSGVLVLRDEARLSDWRRLADSFFGELSVYAGWHSMDKMEFDVV